MTGASDGPTEREHRILAVVQAVENDRRPIRRRPGKVPLRIEAPGRQRSVRRSGGDTELLRHAQACQFHRHRIVRRVDRSPRVGNVDDRRSQPRGTTVGNHEQRRRQSDRNQPSPEKSSVRPMGRGGQLRQSPAQMSEAVRGSGPPRGNSRRVRAVEQILAVPRSTAGAVAIRFIAPRLRTRPRMGSPPASPPAHQNERTFRIRHGRARPPPRRGR